MKTVLQRFTHGATRLLALSLGLSLAATGWADFARTNPVTGETENYTWKFVGTDTWNGSQYWKNSDDNNPSGDGVPAKTGGGDIWDPILFDNNDPGNTININASMSVEGWNLRMGLYNGANVTMNNFVKYQGDTTMWMTVDESSQLTIGGFGGGNITANQVIKLSVAKANGITWTADLTSGNANNTFEYYLKGAGSVSYQAVSAANHKIKMADVTLTGTLQVSHKTLVSFTSSSQTFTAEAAIKVLDSNGDQVATKALSTVNTTGTTTLTTDNAVGTCELVQTSTGIDLYWVDGDPANLPAATVYKPSININFTSGTALSTVADVGIDGYAIPGTSWNNLVGNNGSLATVTGVDDAGVTSTINGAKVTISGTRGYYYNGNVQAASDLRQGYIDDNGNNPSPQFVVEGIPYYSYKTILYFSSDNNETKFGYVTVNGANYKGDLDNTATVTSEGGSDIWGSASVSAFTEGGNYLVIPTQINTDGKLTVVSHRLTGSRAGLAAVQIIEVKPEAGDGDLVIELSGDRTYTVSEAQNLSGTVYLTGNGTLTLDGSAKIEAATIDVGPNVTLNINSARLDATTFTGSGTVVYDTTAPVEGKGWTDSDWSGTVWIKNQAVAKFDGTKYGNAGSTIRFTGVTGYMETLTNNNTGKSTSCEQTVPFELVDDGDTLAFTYNNGWGGNLVKINTLKGTGTLKTQTAGLGEHIYIVDASDFTGVFNLTGKYVYVGGGQPEGTLSTTNPDGKLEIRSGVTMTVPSSKTWTANGGFVVNGTLNVDGTLASSHTTKAVSGAGTVVFTGRAPTVSGDAWWKNADWTGTVQIGSITDLVGTSTWGSGTYLDFDSYGNANSVIKLGNITGWLAGDTCNVPVNLAGTLTINNGFSGTAFTFKKLISNGGYITATDQAATARIVIEDGSEYAGYIGLNAKMVVFGTDNPTFVKGQVYVSSDAKITVPAVNTAYWAVGNIVVAGELKADNLARFGGGTHINTTGDGVFTLTSTGNGQESETNTDYARISGTGGSLKYQGTGWRALSTNNFPTAVTLVNEQAGDILLSRALTYTIGSLAGSKNFQGNYGSGSRYLNVIQSKDTEWSGKVVNDGSSRFAGLKLDASSTGTLKLSGTATQNVALEVNGGAVNLTGTWVGATTVAGTFGGTGTLTGNLTFSDGATFKAGTSALTVNNGTVTTPGSGSVTVDVSAISESITDSGVTLISGGVSSVGTFAVDSAYRLDVDNGALKVYPAVTYVAEYDGVQYETFAEAIAAAEAAGGTFADVTVLDASAELPAGYYIDNNVICKFAFSLTAANDTVTYYAEHGDAVYAAYMGSTYKYLSILVDQDALTPDTSVRYKIADGVTVTTVAPTEEYGTPVQGTPDPETGAFTYSLPTKATTYTWSGAYNLKVWAMPSNWTYGGGTVASRIPTTGDSVVLGTAETITVGDVTVKGITVSAAVTLSASSARTLTASDDGIVLTTEGASITVSNVMLSPTPTTTVANSYVKLTDSTYSVQAYVTVTIPSGVEHATATVNGDPVAGGASVQVDAGSNVTIAWTAASGYKITGGATQTINAIVANTTADTPTVAANSVEFSNFAVEYLADFSKAATITADVSGDDVASATYTLTVGETGYNGTYNSETGKVTFNNVGSLSLGDTLSYTISASGTTSGSSGAQTSTVGNVTDGWVVENSENTGITGTWTTPVTYTAGVVAITDNTYTANTAGDGIVTLTTVVKFGGDADPEVSVGDGAQAAVRVQNSVFEVYGKATSDGTADWQTTAVSAEDETQYTVALTINYTTRKFTVSVSGTPLGEYFLAVDATKVSAVAYKGTGEFTSLNGSFVTGEISVKVDADDVAVSSEFISDYLGGRTVAEAAALLAPGSTTKAENGINNYFECYALGLNPTNATDKLVVDVTTDASGNFVFTVKHPTFDGEGKITGYEAIEAADNVQTTVTYKYGTTAGSTTTKATLDEGGKLSPNEMFKNQSGNVLYYKAEVTIGAKE